MALLWRSVTAVDRKRLDKLISRASSLLGCSLHPVEVVGDRRRGAKLSSMQQTRLQAQEGHTDGTREFL